MKGKKDIKVAYLGQVAPFEPEFYNQPGYGRPGTLAQIGFIEALHNTDMGLDEAWGFRPINHWPKSNIVFERTRRVNVGQGIKLTLLPLINIYGIRAISRYLIILCTLASWALKRRREEKILVSYNLGDPNGIIWVRLVTWMFRIRLVLVVYDLSQIKMYKRSVVAHIREPDWLLRMHEYFIRLCDGLMPITDAIQRDFAPKLKYLRVDGGVCEAVVEKLPPLKEEVSDQFVIFYAGGISPWNRIDILLQYMERNKDPSLRLWIAGGGQQVQMVKDAAAKDSRITFFGFLGPEKLQELYGKADALVTLRDLIDPGLKYHYPSKTFEMLAMGKPLIITNSQHTREVYGEYCKVIDSCDVDSYGAAVEYFRRMTPNERLEYGRRARQYIMENRRWCKWGASMGGLLESIV